MKDEDNYSRILYDGWCHLCSASVQFVIRRDSKKIFRFVSLQSETGKLLLSRYFSSSSVPDSIVYIEDNKAYVRSEAILRILRRLGRGWQLLSLLRIIPVKLRDGIYDLIASSRFRLFGRRTSCHLLPPDREYTL